MIALLRTVVIGRGLPLPRHANGFPFIFDVFEIKEQCDLDAKALALAIRQVNPSTEKTAPTQHELNDAAGDASQNVRAQIFGRVFTWRVQCSKQMSRA